MLLTHVWQDTMTAILQDVYKRQRIAMLRYGINDIRGFYQGDVRFSEQFK